MKCCSLFSGSSGNSVFVSSADTKILIDAGKNGKQVGLALEKIGEEAKDLAGIFITHEHSDHIKAAGVLSRRFDLPVFANEKTWESMAADLGKIAEKNRQILTTGTPFAFQDLLIKPLSTSHDAADPCAYSITDGKKRMCLATDTGILTPDLLAELPGSDIVYLESNHDIGMLEAGYYPYYLKQRIRGVSGHLSNDDASAFAARLAAGGTSCIVLSHLSSDNNNPVLAYQSAEYALKDEGAIAGKDVILEVARRNDPGDIHIF